MPSRLERKLGTEQCHQYYAWILISFFIIPLNMSFKGIYVTNINSKKNIHFHVVEYSCLKIEC